MAERTHLTHIAEHFAVAGTLALAVMSLAATATEAAPPHPGHQDLIESLAGGDAPLEALELYLANENDGDWRLRGRVVAAEEAYRRDLLGVAATLLPADAISSENRFLNAYAEYVLGLSTEGTDARLHFSAAFDGAGDTLLRLRAGLWLADEVGNSGDRETAVEMLSSLEHLANDPAHRADLSLRRALLLSDLGRDAEAMAEVEPLYTETPLLDSRKATRPLYETMMENFGAALRALPGPKRAARVEALLVAKRTRDAAREARSLRSVKDLPTGRADYLLARAELRRSTKRCLSALKRIPKTAEDYHPARLVRASALRRRRKRTSSNRLLAAIASDESAGPSRFDAAARLADRLDETDRDRARELRRVVAIEAPPGRIVDAASWALGWDYYTSGDYEESIRWFRVSATRSDEPVLVARGAYWEARALEHLDQPESAVPLYAKALTNDGNGYYGLASSIRLRSTDEDARSAPLVLKSPTPDPLAIAPTTVLESLEPAEELLRLGLFEDAVAEIQFQIRRFPGEPAPKLMLSGLLHDQGRFTSSVRWLKRVFPDETLSGIPPAYQAQLYPLRYWDTLRKRSEEVDMDPYFAAAVVYQESRFEHRARSPAGALGLMQIMPSTGREIARKLRERGFRPSRLYEPKRNIHYGITYLRGLLDRHGDDPVLALAAYNAGASRVKRWRASGLTEPDEFIEAIPFRETRLYVKKILVAHDGYHRVYGDLANCRLHR